MLGRALHSSRELMSDTQELARQDSSAFPTTLDQCMGQSDSYDEEIFEDCKTTNEVYLYRKAIIIPSGMPYCHTSSVLLSTAIIFNLALTYQLAGEQQAREQKNNTVFLQKAAKLYELAHSLHSEENMASANFILAAANNLGLIYHELHDTQMSKRYFQHLLTTLMFLVDCGQSGTASRHLDGFIRNATSQLLFKGDSAAPAA